MVPSLAARAQGAGTGRGHRTRAQDAGTGRGHRTRSQLFRGFSLGATRLVELFVMDSAETLRYMVTFEDSTLWSESWTAMLSMPKTEGPMFELESAHPRRRRQKKAACGQAASMILFIKLRCH